MPAKLSRSIDGAERVLSAEEAERLSALIKPSWDLDEDVPLAAPAVEAKASSGALASKPAVAPSLATSALSHSPSASVASPRPDKHGPPSPSKTIVLGGKGDAVPAKGDRGANRNKGNKSSVTTTLSIGGKSQVALKADSPVGSGQPSPTSKVEAPRPSKEVRPADPKAPSKHAAPAEKQAAKGLASGEAAKTDKSVSETPPPTTADAVIKGVPTISVGGSNEAAPPAKPVEPPSDGVSVAAAKANEAAASPPLSDADRAAKDAPGDLDEDVLVEEPPAQPTAKSEPPSGAPAAAGTTKFGLGDGPPAAPSGPTSRRKLTTDPPAPARSEQRGAAEVPTRPSAARPAPPSRQAPPSSVREARAARPPSSDEPFEIPGAGSSGLGLKVGLGVVAVVVLGLVLRFALGSNDAKPTASPVTTSQTAAAPPTSEPAPVVPTATAVAQPATTAAPTATPEPPAPPPTAQPTPVVAARTSTPAPAVAAPAKPKPTPAPKPVVAAQPAPAPAGPKKPGLIRETPF